MRAHRGFWFFVGHKALELVFVPAARFGRHEAARYRPDDTVKAEPCRLGYAGKPLYNHWEHQLSPGQRQAYLSAHPDAYFNLNEHPLGIEDSRGDRAPNHSGVDG